MKPIITTMICALPFLGISAQKPTMSYGLGYSYGKFLSGDQYGKEIVRNSRFSSYSLYTSWQYNDSSPYDSIFGRPHIEVGINLSDFNGLYLQRTGSTAQSRIGVIPVVYGKFVRDLLTTSGPMPFRLGYSFSNGIGYCFHPYSYPDNQDNEFIGSRFLIYFASELHAALRIHPNLEIIAAGGFKHLSNSALNRPNKGTNAVDFTIGLKYYHCDTPSPRRRSYYHVPIKKKLHLDLSAGLNLHSFMEEWLLHHSSPRSRTAEFTLSPSFAASLSAMYRYRLHLSSGIGLDYIYASYYRHVRQLDQERGYTDERYTPHVLGISLKHEARYRQLSVHCGLGYYLHRRMGQLVHVLDKPYYETIGLRYYIPYTPIYISYHVMAHLLMANSMQFNVGIVL